MTECRFETDRWRSVGSCRIVLRFCKLQQELCSQQTTLQTKLCSCCIMLNFCALQQELCSESTTLQTKLRACGVTTLAFLHVGKACGRH